MQGILPGLTVFETIKMPLDDEKASIPEYSFTVTPKLSTVLPGSAEATPKTVKSISLSPWNPPPSHLRQKGHLLYLTVTTIEGEQHQITSYVGGFFINKSSNSKFDPFPRSAPKGQSAHSLLSLVDLISPSFASAFNELQERNNRQDPLALFQITNAIPASPWLVPATSSPLYAHNPDVVRSQETYLIGGVENVDTLRDWNEEFQSARELPKETVPDRVFRERLISKLFSDYNDAATRGAVLVARGEIAPLNPTECRDAQIFVYNNIFFSFGADGAGTFTSEGGDDAARVATGKDVAGVKTVYQLDIDGLFAPATVVVDYLGKRIVGQSIIPGIFKQREPGENQIHYGAVEGKDVVAWDERFDAVFGKFSRALKVKKHPVWDKDGKRFELEASVETKGLMGTDGRRYILDLYRLTPLDVLWLEGTPGVGGESTEAPYPHRMTVLRPELIETFSRRKMKEWIDSEAVQRGQATRRESERHQPDSESRETANEGTGASNKQVATPDKSNSADQEQLGVSQFEFSLNPDVFSGQNPDTDDEKKNLDEDEQHVRRACEYLCQEVIPELLRDLAESDISFPMDGRSLSTQLHKRGINIRYIGKIASLSQGTRLSSLRIVCVQDMISRAFKHVASIYLHHLPMPLTSACISHLLNCLLGSQLNPEPTAEVDSVMRALYPEADMSFESLTPEILRRKIELEVSRRFRYSLDTNWVDQIRPLQLLREVSLKLGIQLQSRELIFGPDTTRPSSEINADTADSNHANGQSNGESKKKKKKARDGSPSSTTRASHPCTLSPEDIVSIVPVVKHCSPRSMLAEEALEAGRISIMQGQRKLGQELLLESMSLHEQIYGLIHPEVARAYSTLSMLYYQLEEKDAAVELARKAIIVAERTIGIDSHETLLDFLNLSLFLHQLGDSAKALTYAKHSLELWKIIYGPGHPDSITTINNGAVMLQSLKAYHESRRWFEESLRTCEDVFGKQSINAATLLFQLAQALALDHDSKAAVNRMRESYTIFLNELGPGDKNTKEAESWLEQLTQNAVSIARHAKDVEARRLRSGIRFTPRAELTGSAAGTGAATDSRASTAIAPRVDLRSIDELIKFIEGDQQKSKTNKPQSSRGDPKLRGKATS